jgi:uncharacterized protein
MNLLRLSPITNGKEWRDYADTSFKAMVTRLTTEGTSVPQLAVALDFRLSKPRQIVVVGEPGMADTRAMLRLVHDRFIPNKVLVLVDGQGRASIARLMPFVAEMTRRDGRATIYICEDYLCRLPTADVQTAARLLDGAPEGSASPSKRR